MSLETQIESILYDMLDDVGGDRVSWSSKLVGATTTKILDAVDESRNSVSSACAGPCCN